MAKRIISGMLGAMAALGSLLPLGYAFEIFKDFNNPEVPFWPNVFGVLILSGIAVTGVLVGISFLRFAASGRESPNQGWVKPVLLGVGSFFPAFPLTIIGVDRKWPHDETKVFLPFEASACIGVAVGVICSIVLLRRRMLSRDGPPPG